MAVQVPQKNVRAIDYRINSLDGVSARSRPLMPADPLQRYRPRQPWLTAISATFCGFLGLTPIILFLYTAERTMTDETPLKKKSTLPAGFGGSYDDYIKPSLDLNALLVVKPAATIFMRVEGEDMAGTGIAHGDIVVVDRSLTATNCHCVVAVVNGMFVVRTLHIKESGVELHSSNGDEPYVLPEGESLEITGVVTSAIKQLVKFA
jgi:DNA polymerase V